MLNKENQIHNFISSSGSGTVINYGSGSDFLMSYGSGSTRQKVTVPNKRSVINGSGSTTQVVDRHRLIPIRIRHSILLMPIQISIPPHVLQFWEIWNFLDLYSQQCQFTYLCLPIKVVILVFCTVTTQYNEIFLKMCRLILYLYIWLQWTQTQSWIRIAWPRCRSGFGKIISIWPDPDPQHWKQFFFSPSSTWHIS
jgi:hypothetical protein